MIKHLPGLHNVQITGYTHEGAGVGRIQGQVVFIPGALEGEEILVEIVRECQGILRGELKEIYKPHPRRISPACEVYHLCGGCNYQHVAYPEQLRIKQKLVQDTLRRIGGLDNITVHPVLGMLKPWGYRNKGHFRAGRVMNRVSLGFYAEDSHRLVPYFCKHLFSPAVTSLLSFLEEILTHNRVKIAESDGLGLRHILIRESKCNGEILLCFIVNHDDCVNDWGVITQEICNKFPQIIGVCRNINKENQGPILGKTTKMLYGVDYLRDRIGPFTFTTALSSFFQVNTQQAECLYDIVFRYAGLSGRETVVDVYCGAGTISLYLAPKAQRVIGIEVVLAAVQDARTSARINGINNVEFLQGEAEKRLPELAANGLRPDVVVVDPPRKGCDKLLLDSIIKVKPSRMVYVSCNPATLARDLRVLADGGYAIAEVQPVDMFPQTHHVECVVLMTRVEK